MTATLSKSMIFSLLLGGFAAAQSTQPSAQTSAAPQLSPQAAYDEAMRPLEITRRSMANWSETEMAALLAGMKLAGTACDERTPQQFSGDTLIDYARLCSLGQRWAIVGQAASMYIDSKDADKPKLAAAYSYKINAAMNLKDPNTILSASLNMLQAVPYDAFTDETIAGALHYLQLAYSGHALQLYEARRPLVLKALQEPRVATPAAGNAGSGPAPIYASIHALYADGVAFAAFAQFNGEPERAEKLMAELDAALPSAVAPDDAVPIADTRLQYALLGKPLPKIPLTLSLYSPGETPHINTANYGSTTVLLLFPGWCAQCIRMSEQVLPTLVRVNDWDVHLYGVLAEATSEIPPLPKTFRPRVVATKPATDPTVPEKPKTPAEQLLGTQTLVTPPETLAQFAAEDYPLLVATDPKGIVRFIQPAGENALNQGDFFDQIVMHIRQQWPNERVNKTAEAAPARQPQPVGQH